MNFVPPSGSGDEAELVRIYVAEIEQYAVLTEDDEARLAQAIEASRAAREQLEQRAEGLSDEHRGDLERQVAAGDDAQRTFVQSTLRLVVPIAEEYQEPGVPLLDLIQEGNLGLIHAVDTFDRRKDATFSSHATPWIREAITRRGR